MYFDHRNYESVHIYFYLDGEYYGTVYAHKNVITSVELPSNLKKVCLSFSTIYDPSNEIEKCEMDKLNIPFKCENKPIQSDAEKLSWQFPYNIEIDASEINNDLLFVPAEFEDRVLKGGHYYRAVDVKHGIFIKMKLIKRVKDFGMEEYRRKKLLIWGAIFVAGIIGLPIGFTLYQHEGMDPWWYKTHGSTFVLSILAIFLGRIMFMSYWKYGGMYREKEMQKELIITDAGIVSNCDNVV